MTGDPAWAAPRPPLAASAPAEVAEVAPFLTPLRATAGARRMTTARRAPRAETKLRERAYDAFTQHLLRAEIKPGQFVSQRELVALTGQPLGAIRELIPRLEAEGLIVTVPQRGLQILPVDIELIRNAFQFRLILEREAVAAFTQDAPPSGDRADRGRPSGDRRARPRRASTPNSSSPRPSGSTASSTSGSSTTSATTSSPRPTG